MVRAVKTISKLFHSLLLHSSLHWKNDIDSYLWPMAVDYATFIYNHIPNASGVAPVDIFHGSQLPRHHLCDIHVWGCSIYVLDSTLQQGQKIPCWQPCSRCGLFVGYSPVHSSNVPLILNLQTSSISSQFHIVFEDHFSTVHSTFLDEPPPSFWNKFYLESHTNQTPLDADTLTTLADEWISPSDLEER